jgi:hypothetical protein
MLLKSLNVAGIIALIGTLAAFSPARAEGDHGTYSAVKTNFNAGAYSYERNPRFNRKEID